MPNRKDFVLILGLGTGLGENPALGICDRHCLTFPTVQHFLLGATRRMIDSLV